MTAKNKAEIEDYVVNDSYFTKWTLQQMEAFDKFLTEEGIPANAFVVRVSLPTGGLAWVLFRDLSEIDIKDGTMKVGKQDCFVPNDVGTRVECPEDWRLYPLFVPDPAN